MTSSVEICKMALSTIRAGTINSFDEGTQQAEQCSLWFPILRDQLLEDAPWGFATRVEPLAKLSSDTYDPFDWVYAYQYPSDCARINRLVLNYESANSESSVVFSRYRDWGLPVPDFHEEVNYQLMSINDTKIIAANDADLRINYNSRITDASKFDTTFVMALSHLLAANIAIPLAGEEKGSKLRAENLQIYTRWVNNAIARTLNERHQDIPDSEFITIRN